MSYYIMTWLCYGLSVYHSFIRQISNDLDNVRWDIFQVDPIGLNNTFNHL